MNKSFKQAFVILGYLCIEVIALVISLVISFLTWGMMLYRPDGNNPFDGFGYILILLYGVPIWITIAVLSPFVAHLLFKESSERFKRIGFSFLTPVLSGAITAAVITWILESR